MLAVLGWDTSTTLVTELDRDAQVIWLRDAAQVATPRDVPGACTCQGCTHPAPLPTLPGYPEPAFEGCHIDGKRQLVMPRGLARAVGSELPGQFAVLAVADLEALAVVALSALFSPLFKDRGPLSTQPSSSTQHDKAHR